MTNFVERVSQLFARSRQALTSEEVTQRLQKLEYALEAQYLHKPQAEANLASGQAAAELIAALRETPHAAIQIGTLLIIKTTSAEGKSGIFVRTLSATELALIEANPGLLTAPHDILKMLGPARAFEHDKVTDSRE